MEITEYLVHLKGKDAKRGKNKKIEEEDEVASIIDEAINKIKKIKKLENGKIK